jgi:hypothetical protein
MYIDYVRVYEKTGFNAPAAPALDIEEETIGQVIPPSLAGHAFKDGFADLSNALVLVWGGGGEPAVSASAIAVDGDSSLVFNFPGGSWGGGYIELETPFDLSSYTHMKFSLNKPTEIVNGEIKLESPSTNAVIFLADYTATDVADGFVEYTIPLSDFVGLDLTEVTIPMALWNPQDIDQNFVPAIILIDNVHFGN